MELKIKNFGHVNGAEVRIIKVSDDAVFEDLNAQFQQMDDLGMEHGVRLGRPPITVQWRNISTGEIIQLSTDVRITSPKQIDPQFNFSSMSAEDWSEYERLCADRTDIIVFDTVEYIGGDDREIFGNFYTNMGSVTINAKEIGSGTMVQATPIDLTIGSNVKHIYSSAFSVADGVIPELYFEEGVTTIDEIAFQFLEISNDLILPNSLIEANSMIFVGGFVVPKIIMGSGLTYIPENFFISCKTSEVIIPEGVVEIGNQAFGQNDVGKKVTLPTTLTRIGDSAFMNWTNGEELIFPSVTNIGVNAFFYWGNSLGSVSDGDLVGDQSTYSLTLPDNLEFVEKGAFQFSRFKEIVLNGVEINALREHSFGWCTAEKLTVTGKIINTDKSFMYMGLCTSVDLGLQGITNIGDSTFLGMRKVSNLHIPEGCRLILTNAFVMMEELTNLTFSEGVEEFSADPFGASYPKLEHLVFPNSLKRFNSLNMGDFSALKTLVFGNGLTKMGPLPNSRNWDFKIYIGSPWVAGMRVPSFNYSPYLQVYVPVDSYEQYRNEIPTAAPVLVPYTPPAIPGVVELPPLVPIQTTEPWSIQWRNMDKAIPEQTYFENGIVPADYLKDLPGFDDLIINCPIVANGALDTNGGPSALKRIRIMEGVVDLHNDVLSGMLIGVRELTLPSTLKGLGNGVLTGASFLTSFTNNATTMDSVHPSALSDLPASLGAITPVYPEPPIITEATPTRFAGTGKRDEVISYKITRGETILVDTKLSISHDGTWFDNRAGEGYEVGDKMTAYYIDRMENVSATATVATVTSPPQP